MSLPEHNPRRPYFDKQPDGYLESDRDYLENNNDLAVALLDLWAAGELILVSKELLK